MKILVAGAGPAGLSFAALIAEANPSNAVTVVERTPEDAAPGWGLTLRDHALSFLDLGARLPSLFLEGRALRLRGAAAVDLPNPPGICLATFSRRALIQALTSTCRERGVQFRYQVDAAAIDEAELGRYDLVVAADGAHSAIRHRYAHALQPRVRSGRNRYAWLGAAAPFDKLTVLLEDKEPALLAWAYKYTSELSTFIVECREETWRRAGFAMKSPDEAAATIGRVFEEDLRGARVLAGHAIHWGRFPVVSCERLHYRHVALMGDAAHTTHFSQGFGTMFAFDDALALKTALDTTSDVPEALDAYERIQRPKIANFQATASSSMEWSEGLLEAAEEFDEHRIRQLIADRWPNNAVTPAPLS